MTPEFTPPPQNPMPVFEEEQIAEPKPMSEIARLGGVFFSPGAAFKDIARRPRWWVPILIIGVMSIFTTYLVSEHVGYETIIRQAMDRSPLALQMTPQQREQAIALQSRITKYASYAGILAALVVYAILAGILKFVFDVILGADIGYKRMMAIVTYGSLPQLLVSILTVAVIFIKPPEDIDIQNPLAFNLAAYLPADSAGWLKGFGTAMDLFSFWVIGLLGIGVSSAARKISTGKAIVAILFPWSLWVAVRVVLGMVQG